MASTVVTLALSAAARNLAGRSLDSATAMTPEFVAGLTADLREQQNALPLEQSMQLGGWPEFAGVRVLRVEDRPAGAAALLDVQVREVLAGGCPAGVVSNDRSLLFWLVWQPQANAGQLSLVEPDGDRIDD